LKKINLDTIKNNCNIFVNPILNNIKSVVEDSLNKELLYQIKVENEKVSILNKRIEKDSIGLCSDIQSSKSLDIFESMKTTASVFNLIKYI
jgi:hypothetical protein